MEKVDSGIVQGFNDGYNLGPSQKLPESSKELLSNDAYLEAVKSGFDQYLQDNPKKTTAIHGFNHGYNLSKKYPRLADKIQNGIKIDKNYSISFQAGREEFKEELVKGKDHWKKSRSQIQQRTPTPTKDKGKSR